MRLSGTQAALPGCACTYGRRTYSRPFKVGHKPPASATNCNCRCGRRMRNWDHVVESTLATCVQGKHIYMQAASAPAAARPHPRIVS